MMYVIHLKDLEELDDSTQMICFLEQLLNDLKKNISDEKTAQKFNKWHKLSQKMFRELKDYTEIELKRTSEILVNEIKDHYQK